MKKVSSIIAIVVAVFINLFGCNLSGNDETVHESSETENPTAGDIIGGELENPVIRIMSHYALYEDYMESFSKHYGGEVIQILTPGSEYLTKTAAMIMSNDPLDGVLRDSDCGIHFTEYVSNDLAMPLDEYIDLSEEIYNPVRNEIEYIKWLGNYYFIGYTIDVDEICYFNKKLIEQAGLETPWELYQKDEWTWEKMLQMGEILAQDTNNDGSIDVYGLAISAPQLFVSTTGISGGEMAGDDIILNLRDGRITRAMEMARALLHDYDFVLKSPTAWSVGFGREKVAIALAEAWLINTPEVISVMQSGDLGVAPLPRDPQNSKYNANGAFIGWIVPKHSQNPEGLVAFNKCQLYERYFSEEQQELVIQRRQENGIVEIMEMYDHIRQSQDVLVGWGHAFTNKYMWEYFGSNIPWATYLETVEPMIIQKKNEAIQHP